MGKEYSKESYIRDVDIAIESIQKNPPKGGYGIGYILGWIKDNIPDSEIFKDYPTTDDQVTDDQVRCIYYSWDKWHDRKYKK